MVKVVYGRIAKKGFLCMIPSFWKMESHLIDVPLVLCKIRQADVQIHVLDDCYIRSDDGGKNSKSKSEI